MAELCWKLSLNPVHPLTLLNPIPTTSHALGNEELWWSNGLAASSRLYFKIVVEQGT